ncbi:MAG: type IIL restriction-modification enzyme MmeI [Xanthomonadales bacterium]|nr:type IIL restriction-modification enzyme MmeI [Xanthomonadales bacterium]
MTDFTPTASTDIADFIGRWCDADGGERANYQLFLTELCQLLALPQPDPAGANTEQNAYVFERRVDIHNPDGSSNRGFIDLYKRGCFVLEAKQTGKQLDSQVWDKAMLRAQNQADQYVRALPADEGRPPFIVVTDVGRSLELYAEFSQSGGSYVPFPDPGHYRIRLEDLTDENIQRRLYLLWHDPQKLDPSKLAAQVTRKISAKLAELARSLEQQGYDVERVAHFLKRCLFTMFSEDVDLLPRGSFTQLLQQQQKNPQHFVPALSSLWESMRVGGYSPLLNHQIREFNGGLFTGVDPIPLNADQIQLLIDASKSDWRFVEPAIFGTLLERALDPRERHKLGAHFTPRAYVERLVMPTLIEPLREQWRTVQVVAETWLQKDKPDKAVEELRQFHYQLCQTRVLDPACGSGNFLYVALEHMKRLEGEVLNLISELSAGQGSFSTEGLTVDPHQFLGLELNPRAAAIAEIVLWIGYLQWHYRIHGALNIPDPVLRNFQNIQHRDALITYQRKDLVYGEDGKPVTLWDGISFKPSPTTGELIPDETQRIPVYDYVKPAKAEWPEAEYIVGNPPFIGASTMRRALGDGYVDAVRKVYKGEVPDSADFVMYWWHIAATKMRLGQARQFGFITTNSLRQTFNRRVLEPHLNDKKEPLSLVFAIPDHPWVDSNDGAAVRIAMTVGGAGERAGLLRQVVEEIEGSDESREVNLSQRAGKIFADLTIGANVSGASNLSSNGTLSQEGVKLHGSGFLVSWEEATAIGLGLVEGLDQQISPILVGEMLLKCPVTWLSLTSME